MLFEGKESLHQAALKALGGGGEFQAQTSCEFLSFGLRAGDIFPVVLRFFRPVATSTTRHLGSAVILLLNDSRERSRRLEAMIIKTALRVRLVWGIESS